MNRVVYGAITKELTVEDIDDFGETIKEFQSTPTEAERIEALESAMLDIIMGGAL